MTANFLILLLVSGFFELIVTVIFSSQIIEIKTTNKDLKREDLSKTFVSKKELEEIGQYKKLKKYAEISKDIAHEMKSKLLKGQIDNFGQLLGKAWEIKKKFSSKISNKFLDGIYDYGLKHGALGGKLLGAGSGGYFLFYVPTYSKIKLMNALAKKDLQIETITFDNNGLRRWITKKKV